MRRAFFPALTVLASLVAFGQVAGAEDGTHVVAPGETLWQIAAALTGDAYRWPELYRANRDQIKDPSMLYPGQRLSIPDFGASARGPRVPARGSVGDGGDD